MQNKDLINPQDIQIQGLLDRFLCSKVSLNNSTTQERHLDEDSLAAFTEGNLGEWEALPIVSHLVNCSFCRHVTAELVRLDLAFADDEVRIGVNENQPLSISETLNGLLSRIFGTNDSAVFAHQEKEEDLEDTEDSKGIVK
ncbi:MAG: hypothetical protein M3388_18220 [Acidobacteriota bacterium]|nr:hypothetical protein [Acidobacteriota bacterium]